MSVWSILLSFMVTSMALKNGGLFRTDKLAHSTGHTESFRHTKPFELFTWLSYDNVSFYYGKRCNYIPNMHA